MIISFWRTGSKLHAKFTSSWFRLAIMGGDQKHEKVITSLMGLFILNRVNTTEGEQSRFPHSSLLFGGRSIPRIADNKDSVDQFGIQVIRVTIKSLSMKPSKFHRMQFFGFMSNSYFWVVVGMQNRASALPVCCTWNFPSLSAILIFRLDFRRNSERRVFLYVPTRCKSTQMIRLKMIFICLLSVDSTNARLEYIWRPYHRRNSALSTPLLKM